MRLCTLGIILFFVFFADAKSPKEIKFDCKRTVSIVVDVSGSMSIDEDTRKSRPGPEEIKAAIIRTMRRYLFRDREACVAIFAFATNATMVYNLHPMALPRTQDELIHVVNNLKFETRHPYYYTNWEAGLNIVLNQDMVSTHVYLVTDGLPTTRTTGCFLSEIPCEDALEENIKAAVAVSLKIQARGGWVIPIGMGPEVTDEALARVSGACTTCLKGWNYFHIDKVARLEVPMGKSFEDRLISQISDKEYRKRNPEAKSISFRHHPKERMVIVEGLTIGNRELAVIVLAGLAGLGILIAIIAMCVAYGCCKGTLESRARGIVASQQLSYDTSLIIPYTPAPGMILNAVKED